MVYFSVLFNQWNNTFFTALQDVTSYTVDDEGRLVLEDGATLTFEVAGEAE